jgi:hypothetical protein
MSCLWLFWLYINVDNDLFFWIEASVSMTKCLIILPLFQLFNIFCIRQKLKVNVKVKVKLSLCFKWVPLNEGVLGSGVIAPRILDLGTRRRWVVSFTPRLLHPQGNSPWYPLNRRLGGLQSRSGGGGEEKNSQPPPGIEPDNPDRPARSPALYRLSYHGSSYGAETFCKLNSVSLYWLMDKYWV